MADLASLKTALKQQFIDLYQLAIPEASQDEAIRRTLARLNLALGGQAELAGLDGATQTSLPADWQLALWKARPPACWTIVCAATWCEAVKMGTLCRFSSAEWIGCKTNLRTLWLSCAVSVCRLAWKGQTQAGNGRKSWAIMDTLEIGTRSLNGSQYWVQVLGEGRHPLITSAKYLRRISDQPTVEEELLLFFRGSPADLEGMLRTFQTWWRPQVPFRGACLSWH